MSDQNEQKGNIFIGEGVTVSGNFNIPGRAVVNGTLNGELSADELMVGKAGKLLGQISARNADIHGETHDTLTTSSHLVIRSTGRVHGKASYGELEIERGGLVTGTIVPADAPVPAVTKAASKWAPPGSDLATPSAAPDGVEGPKPSVTEKTTS
jgi:cytoskeletal protein CcmA (bactofilin family)